MNASQTMRGLLANAGIFLDGTPAPAATSSPTTCEAPVDRALVREVLVERGAPERDLGWLAASCPSVEHGHALAAARKCWPASGRNAKGWTDFLRARGMDPDVADDAMKYAGHIDEHFSGDVPEKPPTLRDAGIDRRPLADEHPDRDAKPTNVNGGSGEQPRGAWCTPKPWADAVGPWDLDPFSNPRSHIVASVRCMLEDGGDGMASDEPVWLQPPYERGFVERVIAHYGHTRFCALLRWSPDTGWFEQLWPLVKVVAFPIGERLDFDPPPGVPESSTPHAHAFHYSDPRDVTEEIARRCIVLARHEALRLVR